MDDKAIVFLSKSIGYLYTHVGCNEVSIPWIGIHPAHMCFVAICMHTKGITNKDTVLEWAVSNPCETLKL